MAKHGTSELPLAPRTPQEVLDLQNIDFGAVTKGRPSNTEEPIKNMIVYPLLKMLGWTRPQDVDFNWSAGGGWADIALLHHSKAKVVIETKSHNEKLDQWVDQAWGYAKEKQVPFWVLTNGLEFRLYKTFIENVTRARDHLMLTVHLKSLSHEWEELDGYIGKDAVARERLDQRANEKAKSIRDVVTPQELLEHLRRAKEKLTDDGYPRIERLYLTDTRFKNAAGLWAKESESYALPPEKWKHRLARELAYSFINRLYFARIAEDRGLVRPKLTQDTYPKLRQSLQPSAIVREAFKEIQNIDFRAIYPPSDELGDAVGFDENLVDEIVKGLAQYNFREIGHDIIGLIYERHIPQEERRSLGQFFTPSYAIDFIRQHIHLTSDAKILDPACGSGGFLMAFYDAMSKFLSESGFDKKHMHKRLLREHLYGFDIQQFAVQLTGMNLALRDLDLKGMTYETDLLNVYRQDSLSRNLKHWTSGESQGMDAELSDRILADFPKKFSIIVGNPPYFNIKAKDVRVAYPNSDFEAVLTGRVNIASLFLKKFLDAVEEGGQLGFVMPKSLTYIDDDHWRSVRTYILNNATIEAILDMREGFEEVLLEQIAIIVKKEKPKRSGSVEFSYPKHSQAKLGTTMHKIDRALLVPDFWPLYRVGAYEEIFRKANERAELLGQHARITRGLNIQKYSSVFSNAPLSVAQFTVYRGKGVQRFVLENPQFIPQDAPMLSEFSNKMTELLQPKIMAQRIVAYTGGHLKLSACLDKGGALSVDTVINILPKDRKSWLVPADRLLNLLGIINSKFGAFYMFNFIYNRAVRSMNFEYSAKLPISVHALEDDDLRLIVSQMMELHEQRNSSLRAVQSLSKLSPDGIAAKKELIKIEKKIELAYDELNSRVCQIYGLTAAEKEQVFNET